MFTLTTPVSGACLPWVLGMLVIGPQSSMNGSVSMIIGTHLILRAVEMLAGKGTVYFVRIWNHRFSSFVLPFSADSSLLTFSFLLHMIYFTRAFWNLFLPVWFKRKAENAFIHSLILQIFFEHHYVWQTLL